MAEARGLTPLSTNSVPNRNYEKGYRAEAHIRNTLKARGWIAERTAGSHGPFDVIGVSPKYALLIQSKSGGKPSPSEYKSLVDLEVPPHHLKMVIWFPDGAKAGRILYCADHTGEVPPPVWCEEVRWFAGLPKPDPQQKLRLK